MGQEVYKSQKEGASPLFHQFELGAQEHRRAWLVSLAVNDMASRQNCEGEGINVSLFPCSFPFVSLYPVDDSSYTSILSAPGQEPSFCPVFA